MAWFKDNYDPKHRTATREDQINSERIDPIPENYEGDNIPYRGVVNHGVKDHPKPYEIEEYNPDKADDVEPETVSEFEVDPVPVRVISGESERIRGFRARVVTLNALLPHRIVGKNQQRIRVRIRNKADSGNKVYLASFMEECNPAIGYEIATGEEVELLSTDPVWVMTDVDGSCQFVEEYYIQQ